MPVLENVAHPARERLDVLQRRHQFRIELGFVQEEQLRLGQNGRERVGKIVPQLGDRVVSQPGGLEQRAVQIPQVMIPQVPHRLPEIRFVGGAEDLRRGPFMLGVRSAEQNAPPPRPVFGPTDRETDSDTLPFEFYGGKIMNDGRTLVGETMP